MRYDRLFSPITINGLELKNRIVMTAIHCNYTPNGYASPRFKEFYWTRAEGGAGLFVVGGCRFDKMCGNTWDMMSLLDDSYIPGYKEFTDGMHQRGAKVAVQLFHSGRYAKERYLNGGKAIAPSAVYTPYTKETAREMTKEEIAQTIQNWAAGALRAKKAGFDAVEIVASAGYLICQFISPLTNLRTDEYGGSWENRTRFVRELMAALREAVGKDYPIFFRISGNDFVKGSNTNAEAVEFAKLLDQLGVDMISVTGGWHETKIPQLPGEVPHGQYAYLGAAIKAAVKCPVLMANRMNRPAVGENILAMESADLIGVCRTLMADPQWPNKVKEGRENEIRPCVACNQGCLASTFFGKPPKCLVNGTAGREYELSFPAVEKVKNILVVGAGPAGCEFALRAAERGHKVTVWEKSSQVGGWISLVAAPPGKKDFHYLTGYYKTILDKAGIPVVLNREAAAHEIRSADFDEVVIATGGMPRNIPLDTDGSVQVVFAEDVLAGEVVAGRRVVVLGGGAVGCETAQLLAHNSSINAEQLMFLSAHHAETPERIEELLNLSRRDITVVELAPKAYSGFDLGCAWPIVKDLKRFRVPVHTSTAVRCLRDGKVMAEKTDAEGSKTQLEIPCDTLVLAVGTISQRGLYDELKEELGERIHILGNAQEPGRIMDAVRQADELAAVI